MPDAVIVDIADAVVTALNGASLSKPFTAVRTNIPQYGLTDMQTLQVTVVPVGKVCSVLTRSKAKLEDYRVDVAVQIKCDTDDNTVTDPYVYLGEEIGDLFIDAGPLTGYTSASCLSAENLRGSEAGWAPEHMDQLRQFTGIVRLTFRNVR